MVGLLIRHGHCDAIGQLLAGRREGVPLSAAGREEAAELARALRWMTVAAVYSSPLERALCTAEPLARDHGLPVQTREALTDVDFGAWTGRRLADLAGDPAWEQFNARRIQACAPDGEPLLAVQRRIVTELAAIARHHQGEVVAIVSHAEPIRCAIAAYDGLTLDEILSTDILPAHVSVIGITSGRGRVLGINMRADMLQV